MEIHQAIPEGSASGTSSAAGVSRMEQVQQRTDGNINQLRIQIDRLNAALRLLRGTKPEEAQIEKAAPDTPVLTRARLDELNTNQDLFQELISRLEYGLDELTGLI